MAVYIRRLTWVDVSGRVRTTQALTTMGGVTLQAAIQNASNGDVALESEGQIFATIPPTPVNAPYLSVIDQANLIFSTAVGGTVQLTVPAPKSSIFLADQESVDLANTDVVGIATAAIGNLCGLDGTVVTSLVGGYRTANLQVTEG